MTRSHGSTSRRPRGRRRLLSLAAATMLATASVLAAGGAADARAEASSEDVVTNLAFLRVATTEAVADLLAEFPATSGDVTVRPGDVHQANWIVLESLAKALTARGLTVHVIDEPSRASMAAGTAPTPPAASTSSSTSEDASDDAAPGEEPPAEFDLTALTAAAQEGEAEEAEAPAGDEVEGESSAVAPSPASAPSTAAPAASAPSVVSTDDREVGRVLEFRVAEFGINYVGESRSFVFGPKRLTRAASVDIGGRLRLADDASVSWVGQGDSVRIDRISRGQLAAYASNDFDGELPESAGVMRYVEPVVVGGIVASLVYLFYTNQN